MKKYHIADVLTALEIVMAVVLTGMIFLRISANWAIWVFAIGELCDAFDGICARRWAYPDDGKYRWWRVPETVRAIEHASDIALIAACAFFLVICSNRLISALTLVCGLVIALICALVEVELQTDEFYLLQPERRKEVIIWRRKIYLIGIALGVIFLIFSTSWHLLIKFALCLVGVIIALRLLKQKADRLKNI